MGKNVVGSRFEKLILLSYEVAGEAWREEEDGGVECGIRASATQQ